MSADAQPEQEMANLQTGAPKQAAASPKGESGLGNVQKDCAVDIAGPDDADDNNENKEVWEPNKKLYLMVYMLSICYYGVCLSLTGAIFVELGDQLGTESSTIAYVFSVRSMFFVAGGLLGAYIIDHFEETHKFFAFVVCCSGICLCLVPFCTSVPLMFVLWAPIGFAMGCAELSNSVFIFRLFPNKDGGRMLLLSIAMYHFGKLSAPLIVQAAIEAFGTYKPSMWLFALISFGYALLVPCLTTPPYDRLRALKREVIAQREKIEALAKEAADAELAADDNADAEMPPMPPNQGRVPTATNSTISTQDQSSGATATTIDLNQMVKVLSQRLAGDKSYKRKQYCIVGALILCYAMFSMIRNGFTTFITTYVADYLGHDDSIGRYLIVTFYMGQFVVALVGSSVKSLNPRKSVLASFGSFLACTILMLVAGHHIVPVFIVFAFAGFVGGVTYPFLYAWCELIRPLTGLLSCLFTLAYGCGDALVSVVVAQVISFAGVRWYVVPLLVCAAVACVACVTNSIVFMRYKQQERGILQAVEAECRQKSEAKLEGNESKGPNVSTDGVSTSTLPDAPKGQTSVLAV